MTCKHPNVKLTVSWTEQAVTAGPEVETYTIRPASLRVDVIKCPDCNLWGSVYTTLDGWENRWPIWLFNRMRQLAEFPTIRRAVRACLPNLID